MDMVTHTTPKTPDMTTTKHAGVRQYSIDTLQKIARDLERNPASRRKGTWEQERLVAIFDELRSRRAQVRFGELDPSTNPTAPHSA